MIRKTVYRFVLVVLGVAVTAFGDVVILESGDRVEGEIVSETPAEVLIKRTYKTGIKFTEKIERSKIARIEKGEVEASVSAPVSATAHSRPAASQPVALSDAEKKELLDNALARWGKQDYAAAGTALSKLINGSSRAELDRMSKETVEKSIELSLADMAAEAHLQAAIARSKGQGLTLPFVTEYERPSLVPRLIDAYDEALKKPVSIEPAPAKPVAKPKSKTPRPKPGEQAAAPAPEPVPASQPAGKPLAELLKDTGPFTGTHEEVTAITRQIRFAASLLTARVHYDSEYKTNPEVKKDLDNQKKQLADLQRKVSGKTVEGAAKEPKGKSGTAGGAQQPAHGVGPAGHAGAQTEEQQSEKASKQAQKLVKKLNSEMAGEEGGGQGNDNESEQNK
jgi:hypothetical protein